MSPLTSAVGPPLQRSNSLSGEGATSARPAFTTSLSDFALRSTSPAVPQVEHASRTKERHSYHLRPRSNLSRGVIVAEQDEDEGEGDAEQAEANRTTPADHSQPMQVAAQDDGNHKATTQTDEQEDTETAASLRAFHNATSTSPQIARTINAGYAARMGSLPPLSPKSFKVPYAHPRNHRHHRRDTAATLATSPIVRNAPADDVGEEQIGDLDLDLDVDVDDIELHLDGMDMKMTDLDEATSPRRGRATSSSPPSSPSRRASPRTPRRTSSLVAVGDRAPPGAGSSTHIASQPPPAQQSAPAPLPPSLKRVMYSLRDESEPSQSEIASEAKLTRKLSSAQQAAEVEAKRWNVAARRAGAGAGVAASENAATAAVAPQTIGRRSSPWLLHTGINAGHPAPATVASDLHEEHLLDDVGFGSDDGHTSSDDDGLVEGDDAHDDGGEATATDETQMSLDDEEGDQYHHQPQCGLGIVDVQTPSPRHMDLPLLVSPNTQQQPLYTPSLSTTPTQPPPHLQMGNLTLNLSNSQRKRSGSAWTNFRNSPSATSTHHLHHLYHHHHHHHHPYAVLRGSPGTSVSATGRHLQRLRGGAPAVSSSSHSSSSSTTTAPAVSRLSTSPAARHHHHHHHHHYHSHHQRPILSPGASAAPPGSQQKRKFGAGSTTPVLVASDDEQEPDNNGGYNKRRRGLSPRPCAAAHHPQGYFALPRSSASSSASSPLLDATVAAAPTTSTNL